MHKDTRSWLQVLLFSVAVVLLLLAVRRGYTSYAANNYDAVVTTYQEGNSRATKRAENVDWQDAAAHNLTVYKERLLQSIVKHGFRTPFNRTQWSLFRPVVTCPPGQPLTRYPKAPAVDGSKLLCSLDGVLHRDCVIYSLGSNGECHHSRCLESNSPLVPANQLRLQRLAKEWCSLHGQYACHLLHMHMKRATDSRPLQSTSTSTAAAAAAAAPAT
jgi:hypothetical protein